MKLKKTLAGVAAASALAVTVNAHANNICNEVTFAEFKDAVDTAYIDTEDFGFTNDTVGMWATLVNIAGTVCYVYSVDESAPSVAASNGGADAGNTAWLGSRVISAQKAYTANAFSLETLSIPSGGVFALVQPGGSLYGLQHSNPVDATKAYSQGATSLRYGTENDPMKGKKIGGVNVFGGGFALYDDEGDKWGAVGVSGDTSCRDSAMAYRVRLALAGGLYAFPPNDDGLAYASPPANAFEHPACLGGAADPAASANDKTASDFGFRS